MQQHMRQRTKYGSWAVTAVLAVIAWRAGHLQLWLLPLLFWVYYELCLCPTTCSIQTTSGGLCRNAASGRLYACTAQPSHSRWKNDAFIRMLGIRRDSPAPAPANGAAPAESADFGPENATIESRQTLAVLLIVLSGLVGIVVAVLA
jgi:hypothetical protein